MKLNTRLLAIFATVILSLGACIWLAYNEGFRNGREVGYNACYEDLHEVKMLSKETPRNGSKP